MRRAVRHRLFLLVAVAALVAASVWQMHRDSAATPGPLLPLDPASITHVAMTLQGHPTEHYQRRDAHWWRIDGTPRPADDGRLGELTEIAAAPVASWRPAGDFEPARIGLVPPSATLSLDGHLLEFGATTAIGPLNYVRVGDRVALVSVRYAPRPDRAETIKAN